MRSLGPKPGINGACWMFLVLAPCIAWAQSAWTEPPSESSGATVSTDGESLEPPAAETSKYKYPERFLVPPANLRLGGFGAYAPRFSRSGGVTFEDAVADALNVVGDENSLMTLDTRQPLQAVKNTGELRRSGDTWITDEPIEFEIDEAHVAGNRMKQQEDAGELLLDGDVKIDREGSTLTADRLHFYKPAIESPADPIPLLPHKSVVELRHPLVPLEYEERRAGLPAGEGVMYGENIHVHELNRELTADLLRYNLWQQTGHIDNGAGRAGPLYFSAKELRILGPADVEGEDIWVTTCDLPEPHYRVRMKRIEMADGQAIVGTNARMQVGGVNTPLFLPRLTTTLVGGASRLSTELDLGHRAQIGYFVDVAQWFSATRNIRLAPRVYATTEEGTGFGLDGEYDYMDNPASLFFRSRGSYQTLQTTEDRGYAQLYHRQELSESTVLLTQWEQWSDPDFVKDFYNDIYENRSGPRTFANVTHTRPTVIASATVSPSVNGFSRETEKLPEGTLHFLERPLWGGFYGTLDSTAGYYRTSPDELEAARVTSVARLSYDLNLRRGLNVSPFAEVDGTWYSRTLTEDIKEIRGTGIVGATVQGRVQRPYTGVAGFSGFKHIVVPSVTLSYRPDASLDAAITPRFDDLDDRPGRTRVETILDNVLLGRNAMSGESWRVARLTLYHGTDLQNEIGQSEDYEIELEVRPRPWWGLQTAGEIHTVDTEPGIPGEDFRRLLSFLFFDNKSGKNNMNGRIGYALTEAEQTTLNQEIFYGFGYKLTNNWSFGFQHRYDIERGDLERQTYEIRRRLHKWEMSFRVRDKESGVDVGFEISLIDFPGARFGI